MINYDIAYKHCMAVQASNDLFYPLRVDDVKKLIKSYGIKLVTFSTFAKQNNIPLKNVKDVISSEFSCLAMEKETGRTMIVYNDARSDKFISFTLAHELGHYLMNHVEDNKENENLANCFARNLLAPAPICRKMGFETVNEIKEYFGMTLPAARTRLNFIGTDSWYYSTKINFSVELSYCPF